MKRPFYRKPAPPLGVTTKPVEKASLQLLREKILAQIVTGGLVIGILAAMIAIPGRLQEGNWTLVVVFIIAIALMLIARFVSGIPYAVRAFALLLIVAALGGFTFLSDGLIGNGRIYLLALPVLAGILIGLWGSIASLVGSIVFLGVMGYLALKGSFNPQAIPLGAGIPLNYWLISISTFTLVSSIVTISLNALVNGLESSLRKEKFLSSQIDAERANLESRVTQRTMDLERRLVQIRTAADIVRSIGSILDAQEALKRVVELMRERFDLYYVGVFLVDSSVRAATADQPVSDEQNGGQNETPIPQAYAVLRAGSGPEGEQMLLAGHKLPVYGHEVPEGQSNSMIGWSIANRKPRIALDVGQDAVRFDNPHLPLTRSELSLPLISGNNILGAMTIQSSKPMAFDKDDVTALQGISDSLSAALVNSQLFLQVRQNLEEIRKLNRQYLVESWTQVEQSRGRLEYTSQAEGKAPLSGEGAPEALKAQFPLNLRDQVIGQVTLETEGAPLSAEDQSFVDAITTQAVIALENVRLLEKTQRQAGYERLVAEFSRKVQGAPDLEAILRTAVKEMGQTMGASEAVIRLEIPTGETGQKEEVL